MKTVIPLSSSYIVSSLRKPYPTHQRWSLYHISLCYAAIIKQDALQRLISAVWFESTGYETPSISGPLPCGRNPWMGARLPI